MRTSVIRLASCLLVILLVLGLILSGCGGPGLPEEVKDSAKALKKSLSQTEEFISAQRKKYDETAARPDFKTLAAIAQKENWKKSFDQAQTDLERAKSLYNMELSSYLKKDLPETENMVKTQITRLNGAVKEVRELTRFPFQRMERIRTVMADPRAFYNTARPLGNGIVERVQSLEQGPVAEALTKFPDSKQKISNRFSPFEKMSDQAKTDMTTLDTEFAKSAESIDYGAFTSAGYRLIDNQQALEKKGPKLEGDIGQLYKSYTKVLQDMKVDFYVTINRESWDETVDYSNSRTVSFTRKVSPAVYTALTEFSGESLADLTPGYLGRLNLKNHLGKTWEELNLNPIENWPTNRHNAATFWLDSTKETFFHKYLEESDGETHETDWQPVDATFYSQNINNLGMAILSKPYGEFEPDTVAAPPGMAYVGNPSYGEWKKDSSGESFWSWYGKYALFSHLFFYPPAYYHYGQWNSWRTGYRHNRPYYGRTDSGEYTYGTRGSSMKNSPRYQNTTFAKTGGLRSVPPSVRGGGSAVRGGGPGGKGK